jgi:hypothetical protein
MLPCKFNTLKVEKIDFKSCLLAGWLAGWLAD